jgi:RNA polymerase sigma-70 factor (ECF subfamily)
MSASLTTRELLLRWNTGDRTALEQLLEQNLSWIEGHVRRKLGPALRSKMETNDIVQEAMVEFLRHGPRFVVSDPESFRGLVARIIGNTLGHHYEWFTAKRRAMSRERPLPSDSILNLDDSGRVPGTPSQHARREEREAWARLGLELLGHEDREIVLLRIWEGYSFVELGEHLGIGADAARMRLHRAIHRMAEEVRQLRGAEGFLLEDGAPEGLHP